jgi:type I restriction enzyme S subunit
MKVGEKLLPELRFPGFDETYLKYKLIDISLNGFNNGVFNDPKKVGKGYKLITQLSEK